MPLFARKFIVDTVETAIGLLLGLTLVFPTTLEDGKAIAIAIGGALLSAAVSAARRAAPGFLAWFSDRLGVNES